MDSIGIGFGIIFMIVGLALAVLAGMVLYRDKEPRERRAMQKSTPQPRAV
jgi:hypothetical protein